MPALEGGVRMRGLRTTAGAAAIMAIVISVAACGLAIGGGQPTTETRPAASFTKLSVGGGIGVTVTIGPSSPMVVSGPSDVVAKVETTDQGDTLVIQLQGAIVSDAISVTVSTPALDAVEVGSGSHVDLGAIAGADFAVDASGGARISLTAPGTIGALDLAVSGGARADLDGLAVEAATVDLSGGANATISASDSVNGEVSGGAHLTIKGDAVVDVETSGGGSVSQG